MTRSSHSFPSIKVIKAFWISATFPYWLVQLRGKMGDIGKEFKYAELGRYGYCTNVAFLWGGASLSLSLGQDVFFSFIGTRCVFFFLWDKMCFFLWHCYSWVAAVSCCPISQRFKCKRSFWRQQRSLKDGKRRQKSLSSNFAQIILLRQSASQIMLVNLPWWINFLRKDGLSSIYILTILGFLREYCGRSPVLGFSQITWQWGC